MAFDLATAQAPAAQIPTYTPAKDDEKMIRDAIAFIVVKAPFFAHLLYNEMLFAYSTEIPLAATDGKTIFLNPIAMKQLKWTLAEVAFVICHEVAHGFLRDLVMAVRFRAEKQVIYADTKLPYNDELMNWAEDFRINAMLVESKIGKMPQVGLYDKNISEKGMEAAVEIYRKLYQQAKGGGGGSGKPGGSGKGFDLHLVPEPGAVKRDPGKTQQAIVAAAMAAEASGQGTIPSCVKQLLGDILDPKVPWQDKLRSSMIRKGGDPVYDWRYLDRRLMGRPTPMYFAKQAHTGAGTIVIGYDTSGSCVDQKTQARFFAEMNGIVGDLNPQRLIVVWCDAAVQRVDDLEEIEDLEELRLDINRAGGAPGGGGTSFRPVFKWIEEEGIQPDMLVYLTDIYGSFPDHEPDYPVIWATIGGTTVPWGEVVEVEL